MTEFEKNLTEKEKIHIAACFDRGYVMPTGVMMFSACVNNPDVDIDFHLVIDESVTDKEKNDLIETISQFEGKRAIFYNVDSNLYNKLPLYNFKWITRATYYRIFLPEILPDSVHRVIYLDGDCIVNHSLISLWDTDISGCAVASVFEPFEGDIIKYNILRYPPELGYFNAGMLFINNDYWRIHHVVNSLTEYICKYPERVLMEDQDVLNVVLKNEKKTIHAKYNFQTDMLRRTPFFYFWKYEEEVKEAIENPIIIHFTSREKPWHAYVRNPHPFRSTYYKYQDQTKWRGLKIEKRHLKKRISNHIADWLRQINVLPSLEPLYIEVPPID